MSGLVIFDIKFTADLVCKGKNISAGRLGGYDSFRPFSHTLNRSNSIVAALKNDALDLNSNELASRNLEGKRLSKTDRQVFESVPLKPHLGEPSIFILKELSLDRVWPRQ